MKIITLEGKKYLAIAIEEIDELSSAPANKFNIVKRKYDKEGIEDVSDVPPEILEVMKTDRGKGIRMLREHRGITQKQLSELTGINQGNISSMEKGRITGNINTIQKIADQLGVKIQDIIRN